MGDLTSAWTREAAQRLKLAADGWGSQRKLAEQLGMHKNTLGNILAGDGDPGISRVAAIAAKVGVSLDWILTGRGQGVPSEADEDLVGLPMLTPTLAAGAGSIAGDAATQALWRFPRSWLRRSFGHEDQLELLRVVGDSMQPELSDGDWVMVDRRRRDPRDGLYAVRLGDALLVKRVQFQGRNIRLVSTNPAYEPIVVDRNDEAADLELLGAVVWSEKVHVAA
ncbi:MAG TPA: XRE family transcriptional regulator [Allosphingosinicella sp.]